MIHSEQGLDWVGNSLARFNRSGGVAKKDFAGGVVAGEQDGFQERDDVQIAALCGMDNREVDRHGMSASVGMRRRGQALLLHLCWLDRRYSLP